MPFRQGLVSCQINRIRGSQMITVLIFKVQWAGTFYIVKIQSTSHKNIIKKYIKISFG